MTVTTVHHASWCALRPTTVSATTPQSQFTAGSAIPHSLTQLNGTPTINPGATWVGQTGRYVKLGNGTTAYWNGTTWVAGVAT